MPSTIDDKQWPKTVRIFKNNRKQYLPSLSELISEFNSKIVKNVHSIAAESKEKFLMLCAVYEYSKLNFKFLKWIQWMIITVHCSMWYIMKEQFIRLWLKKNYCAWINYHYHNWEDSYSWCILAIVEWSEIAYIFLWHSLKSLNQILPFTVCDINNSWYTGGMYHCTWCGGFVQIVCHSNSLEFATVQTSFDTRIRNCTKLHETIRPMEY